MEEINNSQLQENSLPIISQQQAMKELDCSRYFLHTLEKEEGIQKVYLRDKPYYYRHEILALLKDKKIRPVVKNPHMV